MKAALVHFNHSSRENLTTWPDMRTSGWKPNYGDMLVCAAILRQIPLEDPVRVGFGDDLSQKVERALIRGSTYLHGGMDFDAVNRTLDSIDAPLAIVGLGAQHHSRNTRFLDSNKGARDFVARLAERSASISARGEFTAAVVGRLGAKNIRVTGCPSLFYGLAPPRIAVPERLSGRGRRIGISLHSELQRNMFCAAPNAARRAHVQAIRQGITECAGLALFEQGVMAEFDAADERLPMADRLAAAVRVIRSLDAKGKLAPEDIVRHMVSVRSIEEWLSRAAALDAIIGFRFHGNMVALLQGKPCFYYVYDSRIAEFCQLYALPHHGVRDGPVDPFARMLDHDWDETNAAIRRCLTELTLFYRENGFPTALSQ